MNKGKETAAPGNHCLFSDLETKYIFSNKTNLGLYTVFCLHIPINWSFLIPCLSLGNHFPVFLYEGLYLSIQSSWCLLNAFLFPFSGFWFFPSFRFCCSHSLPTPLPFSLVLLIQISSHSMHFPFPVYIESLARALFLFHLPSAV